MLLYTEKQYENEIRFSCYFLNLIPTSPIAMPEIPFPYAITLIHQKPFFPIPSHLDVETGQGDVWPARRATELQLLVCQGFRIPFLSWRTVTKVLTLLKSHAAHAQIAFWHNKVSFKGDVPGVLHKKARSFVKQPFLIQAIICGVNSHWFFCPNLKSPAL